MCVDNDPGAGIRGLVQPLRIWRTNIDPRRHGVTQVTYGDCWRLDVRKPAREFDPFRELKQICQNSRNQVLVGLRRVPVGAEHLAPEPPRESFYRRVCQAVGERSGPAALDPLRGQNAMRLLEAVLR